MSKLLVTFLIIFHFILNSYAATCESHTQLLNSELSEIGFINGTANLPALKISTYTDVSMKKMFDCKAAVQNRNSLRRKMNQAIDKDDDSKTHKAYIKSVTHKYLASESEKHKICNSFHNYFTVDAFAHSDFDNNIFSSNITDTNTSAILQKENFSNLINKVTTYTLNKKKIIIYYESNKPVAYYIKDETLKTNYFVDLQFCPANIIFIKNQKINCLEKNQTENDVCKKIATFQLQNGKETTTEFTQPPVAIENSINENVKVKIQ